MAKLTKVTPCLWFDTDGEEAAGFYTGLFENSRILNVVRYGSAGPRPEGMVMVVNFELDGQEFIALNGGPDFTFDEAISFQVNCESQAEVDDFWAKLSDGGEEGPSVDELMRDPNEAAKAQRVMKAMLAMKKIDTAELQRAADAA